MRKETGEMKQQGRPPQDGALFLEDIRDFDTDHIFDCGQCFRWKRNEDGSYGGIAGRRVAAVSYDQQNRTLRIGGASEEDRTFWENYFDLGRDYGAIKAVLSEDEVMAGAIRHGSGIRILRQDKWETMVSFIISQNNNIPRIKGCIENLSRSLGEYLGRFGGRDCFGLPEPEVLAEASLEDLAPVRLGYRAKYLIETGKMVAEEGRESLEKLADPALSHEEVLEALRRYPGVGPKVANCIALFGLGRMDSFPLDVWMKRVMAGLYGFGEKDVKGMTAFAAEKFGPYGGLAQQYLFYYITHFPEEFQD